MSRGGAALLSYRFVHFRRLAAATLITRYREYFNILSRERIRKRRRMVHYVTYSKSYYTGRYRGANGEVARRQRLMLYALSLSRARAPSAINCEREERRSRYSYAEIGIAVRRDGSPQTLGEISTPQRRVPSYTTPTHKHYNVNWVRSNELFTLYSRNLFRCAPSILLF